MIKDRFDKDQIKKINELYHDHEADIYSENHHEMVNEEKKWEALGEKYFKQDKRITVLDVGTGDGFVPHIIGKYLKENDLLICSDISEKMLEKAEQRLLVYNKPEKKFIQADALKISKMGLSADIVTLNSVLHHLPDYEEVLEHLARLVKENGFFIIMHERNQKFCKKVPVFMKQFIVLVQLKNMLRRYARKTLSLLGLYKHLGIYKRNIARHELYSKVNDAIKKAGISDKALSVEEINALVDLHDPDEGGEGFDPFLLHDRFFREFEIVELSSDKHLGPWVSMEDNFLKNKLLKLLERKYPYSGAIFGLVMKKRSTV